MGGKLALSAEVWLLYARALHLSGKFDVAQKVPLCEALRFTHFTTAPQKALKSAGLSILRLKAPYTSSLRPHTLVAGGLRPHTLVAQERGA